MSSPRAPSLAASLVPSLLACGLGRAGGAAVWQGLSRQWAGELLPEACGSAVGVQPFVPVLHRQAVLRARHRQRLLLGVPWPEAPAVLRCVPVCT